MSLRAGLYRIVNVKTGQWIAAADFPCHEEKPKSVDRCPNRTEIVRTVKERSDGQPDFYATILVSQHKDPGSPDRRRYSFSFVETTPHLETPKHRPEPDQATINCLQPALRIGNNIMMDGSRFAVWTYGNHSEIHTWRVEESGVGDGVYTFLVPTNEGISAWANDLEPQEMPVTTGNCEGSVQLNKGPSKNSLWRFEKLC